MWLQMIEMEQRSIALEHKRQPKQTHPRHTHLPWFIPLFFGVSSRVELSTAEGDGRGIKVRNRHWHGRVRSGFWLATSACFRSRAFFFPFFFQRVDSLPHGRWLQRTSGAICITNVLNKERHAASSQDWGQPETTQYFFLEDFKPGHWLVKQEYSFI